MSDPSRRKSIPANTLTHVIVSSRRRCCVCYGLNRSVILSQGQVAHLDHNSSNNNIDNLAFLCLMHHDSYDSSSSQSKNFTSHEVKCFRTELINALERAFAAPSTFGVATEPAGTGTVVDGQYIRVDDISYSSAEIIISRIAGKHNEYHISGFALWGRTWSSAPNIGDFDHVMVFDHGRFDYVNSRVHNPLRPYRIVLTLSNGLLRVDEENSLGQYGLNVSFDGNYRKNLL